MVKGSPFPFIHDVKPLERGEGFSGVRGKMALVHCAAKFEVVIMHVGKRMENTDVLLDTTQQWVQF